MGNRAVIAFKSEPTIGLYVHWNGGVESVLAFLEATKRRAGEESADAGRAMARLTETVSRYFTDGMSVYVGPVAQLDTDNGDNGTYWIGDRWNIVKRENVSEQNAVKRLVMDLGKNGREYYIGVLAGVLKANALTE